jgi:ribonucleoside-diphosphate reductase alpha chain
MQNAQIDPTMPKVIRRDTTASLQNKPHVVPWIGQKIEKAVAAACRATKPPTSETFAEKTRLIVESKIRENNPLFVHIEEIQDLVQTALVEAGAPFVAIQYALYRGQQTEKRNSQTEETEAAPEQLELASLGQIQDIKARFNFARTNLELTLPEYEIINRLLKSTSATLSDTERRETILLNAKTLLEVDADCRLLAARILLTYIYEETLPWKIKDGMAALKEAHKKAFLEYIPYGISVKRLDPRLQDMDLETLADALDPYSDLQFDFLGMQTLYDRYLINERNTQTGKKRRLEAPQFFWMRVAMGLTLNETQKTQKAIEFYNIYKTQTGCSSTPTLFNAGTLRPQLSSCYLLYCGDSIEEITETWTRFSHLSKWAGGLGCSWSAVRGSGAHIEGTNGESSGIIPFLKVANDIALAINQCFDGDTRVITKKGNKAIRDVKVGDYVLTEDSNFRRVKETLSYPQKKEDPMVQLLLKHGSNPIKVTAGHPFMAITGIKKEENYSRIYKWLEKKKIAPDWTEAGELKEGDFVGMSIPTQISDDENITPEDCRFIGAMCGNGHITTKESGITCGHTEFGLDTLNFIRNYLKKKGIHTWENELHGSCTQIKWSNSNLPTLQESDLYTEDGTKKLPYQYMHLPPQKTLQIIHGLVKTDGGFNRNNEIHFYSCSETLMENCRYQLLRLGIPTHVYIRDREYDHTGTRQNGKTAHFKGECREYKIAIPLVTEIAAVFKAKAIKKLNWLRLGDTVFTRIKTTKTITPSEKVYDLKVDGPESYCIADALVHNGGKRPGALCSYLELWHLDIEDFLDLRKETGDDRRRTHNMNTAHWIPDLFMKRLQAISDGKLDKEAKWTLFRSNEVPDLPELSGSAFERRYTEYEQMMQEGKIYGKQIRILALWKRMLEMLFETGHPWITFKDPCNVRSPQDHVGVIHNSNLCCMTKDQRVVTENGIYTVDELYKKGTPNVVLGRTGPVTASAMLLPRPNAPIVNIVTYEGFTHKVTPDHKVSVLGKGQIEAQNLEEGDKIELQQTKGLFGTIEKEKDAYMEGVLTGDNNRRKATKIGAGSFVNSEERLRKCASSLPLTTPDTKIPEYVWKGTEATMLAYIKGILYSNAVFNIQLDEIHLVLDSDSETWLKEIQILLLNFGIKSYFSARFEKEMLYTLRIKNWGAIDPLIKIGKFLNLENEEIEPSIEEEKTATFSHLESLPNEDAYCLQVDTEEHLWVVNGMLTRNTEITLNTSSEEVAVCNLASVNIYKHIDENGNLDAAKLKVTVSTLMRMLDNVIDINFYPVEAARLANMRHRPVGLGIMGMQDAMYKKRIAFDTLEAVEFHDLVMENICYFAYEASADIAKEKGTYQTFKGSKWDRGMMPLDTLNLLDQERGIPVNVNRNSTKDWEALRAKIKENGMRNSNCIAIAPTATISNIMGCTPCIEPSYKHIHTKSNLSGEFVRTNDILIKELQNLGIWNKDMLDDLKYFDGSIQNIDEIPQEIKALYKTAFEIEPTWILQCAAVRQKWIDQAQSTNLWIANPDARTASFMYREAWARGLKTTYYLRTLNKSSIDNAGRDRKPKEAVTFTAEEQAACSIEAMRNGGTCEACQ